MSRVPESASLREDFSVSSTQEQPLQLPFIPDYLEEYPLTSDEFRIYCYVVSIVAKNGSCMEPVVNMAQTCRMSVDATNKALKALTQRHKFLYRNKRADSTYEYTVAPVDQWTPRVSKKNRTKPKGFGSR